jgi:hypothetical protein
MLPTPNSFARKREIKRGSFSSFALDPNPAAVHLHDLPEEGQPNPCALRFWIQLVEDAKDLYLREWIPQSGLEPNCIAMMGFANIR